MKAVKVTKRQGKKQRYEVQVMMKGQPFKSERASSVKQALRLFRCFIDADNSCMASIIDHTGDDTIALYDAGDVFTRIENGRVMR